MFRPFENPPSPPPPPDAITPGDLSNVDYTQFCGINCDFCLGYNATKDCVECWHPCIPGPHTAGTWMCPQPNTDWCKRCCSKVVPVFGFGGFLLCKECRELMYDCVDCLDNAGEACSAKCIQFKINMKRAIERRRLRWRTMPVAANTMSPPAGVQPPPAGVQRPRYAELGGKKSKSRGLRRRKSKSKLSGLRRRKSKSKSGGLRRRKTMTSRG